MSDLFSLYVEAGSPNGDDQPQSAHRWAADQIATLRHQLQQAEARVAELEPIVEELANDLESEIEARRPGELDRRIERDLIVIKEARDALSRSNGKAFILRKQAEAVDASKSLFSRWSGSIITVEHGRVILEQEASRLRQQADEMDGKQQ